MCSGIDEHSVGEAAHGYGGRDELVGEVELAAQRRGGHEEQQGDGVDAECSARGAGRSGPAAGRACRPATPPRAVPAGQRWPAVARATANPRWLCEEGVGACSFPPFSSLAVADALGVAALTCYSVGSSGLHKKKAGHLASARLNY